MSKSPYVYKEIHRRNLPSFERAQSVGYLIEGASLCTISMSESGTEWKSLTGVELDVQDIQRGIVSGVKAVLVGSVFDSSVTIFDVIRYGKISYRGKSWSVRSEAIDTILDSVSKRYDPVFRRAKAVQRGMIPAFDDLCKRGGLGILLWRSGFSYPYLCRREDVTVGGTR